MKRFLASLAYVLLLSAFAQNQSISSLGITTSSFSTGPNGAHGTMHFGRLFSRMAIIAGAPFSAEEVDEDVQTLADGTHIRHTSPGMKIYRDSMGRTRTERQPFMGPVGRPPDMPEGPTIVEINDPVAHVNYLFDLSEPVAHRRELPAGEARGISTQAQTVEPMLGTKTDGTAAFGKTTLGTAPTGAKCPDPPAAAPKHEVDDGALPHTTMDDLGTQIIEGIPAEGKRHTTTWPVGSVGNDRPITTTSETWTSPELKEAVLTKSDDPRQGEHTHKLVSISRNEPDPSLFEPPPGYTVKNEKAEFTLNWGTTR